MSGDGGLDDDTKYMRDKHFHEYSRRDLVLMMAEEILSMDSEIEELKNRNRHLEKMNEMYRESLHSTERHNSKMTGAMLLTAIGAPDAAIELLESE